jgi:hypothetical protein
MRCISAPPRPRLSLTEKAAEAMLSQKTTRSMRDSIFSPEVRLVGHRTWLRIESRDSHELFNRMYVFSDIGVSSLCSTGL